MSCTYQKRVSSSIFKKVEIVKVYGRSVIIISNSSLQIRFTTLSMFNSSDSYFVFSVHDDLIFCSIFYFLLLFFFAILKLFIILNYSDPALRSKKAVLISGTFHAINIPAG